VPLARLVTVTALAVMAASITPPVLASEDRPGTTRDVIVRLAEGASPAGIAREVAGRGSRVERVYRHAIDGFAASVPAGLVEELRADPRVAAVEPDLPVWAFAPPTGIRRTGVDQYGPADIDGDGSTVNVDVAILDTGVDGSHPDLRVVAGIDCRVGSCATVTPTDPNGHGTHVAGTVGARDDDLGVVGVAPGARLHSVRVLEADGSGSMSSLLAGLEWLRVNAETVETANLSLGCQCRSTTLDDAVRAVAQSGVTLVVAAGNAGTDAGSFSPANHPDVIAVAAMSDYDGTPGRRSSSGCLPDADDSFGSYSNYGAVVDLVAPGSCITSTLPGGRYGRSTGTSMAAPHVTGAAALHIATEGVPRSSSRPAAVLRTLLDRFSVPSTDGCGYTDSVSIAPMLHLTCAGLTGNTHPTLDVSSPRDGLTVVSGDRVALRATAQDAEDGSLDASIVWRSSVAGPLGNGPALDVALTQIGDHTIVASVTDSSGANTRHSRLVRVTDTSGSAGSDGGEEPQVPQEPEPEASPSTDNAPRLTVVAPVPDARIVADREVQLVSSAVDVEDGDIRAWVTWRSDRDGELGTGGTVGVRLSSGTHRITAAVTDSADNRVQRTTSVLVGAPQDLGSRPITDACPPERTPSDSFRDVDEDNPHAAAIDCVAWWGIAGGTGDGNYGPSRHVTRAQMASFLAELIRRSGGHLPEPTRDHFRDDDGTTHEDSINRLAEAGIVRGTGDATYAPTAEVTREQMGTFLARAYEQRSSLALPRVQVRFDDVTSSHAPNVDAIATAGIAAGVEPRRYAPHVAVRRDQMASFIARTLDVLVDMNITVPPA
jgi:subtilisin family serine protease